MESGGYSHARPATGKKLQAAPMLGRGTMWEVLSGLERLTASCDRSGKGVRMCLDGAESP